MSCSCLSAASLRCSSNALPEAIPGQKACSSPRRSIPSCLWLLDSPPFEDIHPSSCVACHAKAFRQESPSEFREVESGDAIGRDQRESVMRGVRRNPGSLSSTTTWESTRGSGASQREHDEHKDGAMVPPPRETNGPDRWRKSRPMVRGVDTKRRPI